MKNTVYYTPTKIVFGKGAEDCVGKELKNLGVKNVLVHYGSDRVLKNGLMSKVFFQLDKENIKHIELGGVVPNPRVSLVRKGAELCRKNKIDFILGVGGGSVIDSAKAIGYATLYNGDVWDFYLKKEVPTCSLPTGVVLTMAAAGSEMSNSSVITNEEGNLKRGLSCDLCRLKIAFENPELTYTLPFFQTACGIVDIQMHTMERFLFPGNSLHLTDNLALSLIRTVRESAYKIKENPEDYQSRATIMWASSLSHNGLMEVGNVFGGDWSSHFIEHELSGMFDIPHGAGLSVIWPAWADYIKNIIPERIAQLGYGVFGIVPSESALEDASKTIKSFKEFYRDIGMPVSLSDLGIHLSKDEIEELSYKATFFGSKKVGIVQALEEKDIIRILEIAE